MIGAKIRWMPQRGSEASSSRCCGWVGRWVDGWDVGNEPDVNNKRNSINNLSSHLQGRVEEGQGLDPSGEDGGWDALVHQGERPEVEEAAAVALCGCHGLCVELVRSSCMNN